MARARAAFVSVMSTTLECTSPGQLFARANLVALIQAQVARIAALPPGGDRVFELHELERLQDRLDGD